MTNGSPHAEASGYAARALDARSQGRTPGILPAAASATVASIVVWALLAAGTSTIPASANGNVVSELAQVADGDVAAAIGTMIGPPALLGQFSKRGDGCSQPLAWVALSLAPGQPDARIRLQSGGYFSPTLTVSDRPVRVAIPYPARYAAGSGTLTVLHGGGDAVVSLTPPLHLSGKATALTRTVTWTPGKRC